MQNYCRMHLSFSFNQPIKSAALNLWKPIELTLKETFLSPRQVSVHLVAVYVKQSHTCPLSCYTLHTPVQPSPDSKHTLQSNSCHISSIPVCLVPQLTANLCDARKVNVSTGLTVCLTI